MSLADDFRMYYGESYIQFTGADGVKRPAFVTGVDNPRNFNPANNTEAYSAEAVARLRFHIVVVHGGDFDGDRERIETLNDGNIDLDLPELGYVNVPGRGYQWLSYKPVHMSKKGLVGRRVRGTNSLGNAVAINIFNAINNQPNNLARQFHFHRNNELHYKGRVVGTYEGDVVTLHKEAKHLADLIPAVFNEKTVVMG